MSWAPHPKFSQIISQNVIFSTKKRRRKDFLALNFLLVIIIFGRNNLIMFHTRFCFYIQLNHANSNPQGKQKKKFEIVGSISLECKSNEYGFEFEITGNSKIAEFQLVVSKCSTV